MLKINVVFCSDTANTLACKYICSFTFFVFKLLILLSCGKLLFLLLIGNFSMLKKAFIFSLLITRQHVCKLEDMNLLGRKVLYINSSVFFQIFLLGKAKKKKNYSTFREYLIFIPTASLCDRNIFICILQWITCS